MTRANVNMATLYSSAQCVLSVVGSVGVILLFAGIPQLIYSPTVSVANLMTFLLGAILITTMVAGNSFLNYKYRKFTRTAQQSQRDVNSTEAAATRAEADDKPPSYEAILSSDGLPPDYFSILSEKPPKYEDVTSGIFTSDSFIPAVPLDPATTTTTTTTVEVNSCISDAQETGVTQPKGTTIKTEAKVTTAAEVTTVAEVTASPSKPKKEDVSTTQLTTPQVTIGYDNDAYSEQGETPGDSPSADLRESES